MEKVEQTLEALEKELQWSDTDLELAIKQGGPAREIEERRNQSAAIRNAIAIIKAVTKWGNIRTAIGEGFNSSREYDEANYNLIVVEQELLSLLSPVEQTKEA